MSLTQFPLHDPKPLYLPETRSEIPVQIPQPSSGQPALKQRCCLLAEGITVMKSLMENTAFQVKEHLSMFGADMTTAILLTGKQGLRKQK